MSYLTKFPVAETLDIESDVFLHEYLLKNTSNRSVASISKINSCAGAVSGTDELVKNEQGSEVDNLSRDSWNRTESRSVIIWDEGRSVTAPQEIAYVRIH